MMIAGDSSTYATAAAYYNRIDGGQDWHVDVTRMYQVVSTPGYFRDLFVQLSGNVTVANSTVEFAVYVDGVATGLSVIFGNGEGTTGKRNRSLLRVNAGAKVAIVMIPTNSPNGARPYWCVIFESDYPTETLILGTFIGATSTNSTRYNQPDGGSTWNATEANLCQYLPTGGTIKKLFIALSADPGDPGDSYTFTVMKNGAPTVPALTCTVSDPDTSANDSVNSFSVVAGDTISLRCVPGGTPVAVYVWWGMCFEAGKGIPGEAVCLGGEANRVALNPAATWYNQTHNVVYEGWAAGTGTGLQTAEQFVQMRQRCKVSKLYIVLSADPGTGAGEGYTISLQYADGTIINTVTLIDAQRSGQDTTNTKWLETTGRCSLIRMCQVPIGVPVAVANQWWSWVRYMQPEYDLNLPLYCGKWGGRIPHLRNNMKLRRSRIH